MVLDPTASLDARWDAIDLFRREAGAGLNAPEWADDEVIMDALTELASRTSENADVRLSAAETLALVWISQDSVESIRFSRLHPDAKREVRAYFELNRPNLLIDLS